MWNLIAVGLIFVVMAVGAVYAFGGFNSTSQQQAGQDLTQETAQIVTQITDAYAAIPNFAGINAQVAETDQYAPRTWQVSSSGTYFILPEGGTAKINATGFNHEIGNAFELTYAGLNPTECSAVAGLVTPNMLSVFVNNSSPAFNPAYATSGKTSQWPQNLTSDCVAGSNNAITIAFVGQ